jgi:hypothetical protein
MEFNKKEKTMKTVTIKIGDKDYQHLMKWESTKDIQIGKLCVAVEELIDPKPEPVSQSLLSNYQFALQ